MKGLFRVTPANAWIIDPTKKRAVIASDLLGARQSI